MWCDSCRWWRFLKRDWSSCYVGAHVCLHADNRTRKFPSGEGTGFRPVVQLIPEFTQSVNSNGHCQKHQPRRLVDIFCQHFLPYGPRTEVIISLSLRLLVLLILAAVIWEVKN